MQALLSLKWPAQLQYHHRSGVRLRPGVEPQGTPLALLPILQLLLVYTVRDRLWAARPCSAVWWSGWGTLAL